MRFAAGAPLLAACLLWASCARPSPAPPPPPPPLPELAVSVPLDSTAVYLRADSAQVEMDSQGQIVTVDATFDATLGVGFAQSGQGVQVTVAFQDFQGRVANPLAEPRTATEEEISGTLVFHLDPRGNPTVVSRPDIKGAAAEFLSAERVAADLFPRLPARAVVPGDAWTDTVRVASETASTRVSTRTVLRSRVAGDTLVGSRSYLLVRFQGESEQTTSGSQAGFEMSQALSGTIAGHFLWDMERRLLRSLESRSELTGTMRVSSAPFPLSVRARSISRTRLLGS